ncbi:MAG: hypothetical protein ACFFAJ_16045 [Candidatus Hodarchaeota archaeon]
MEEGAFVSQTNTLETSVIEMEKGEPFAGKYKIIEDWIEKSN